MLKVNKIYYLNWYWRTFSNSLHRYKLLGSELDDNPWVIKWPIK